MAEQLSGVVERVTFHSPETGFAVLRVQARGRRGLVTVVGTAASVTAGEYVEAVGSWVQDREHGEQFKADELRCTPPQTVEGVEKYLGSGLVKGIGPRLAREIVKVFGERTLAVIDESPSFLREVKGIGPRRIQRIREGWRQHQAVRAIMVFLQSHGVGTARAVRIYKTYGDQAVETVRANPYRLATDIWGVGFKTADDLGRRMGFDPQSPQRARAALRFLLQRLGQEGHVGYPEPALLDPALLREKAGVSDIPVEVLAAAVEAERQAGEIVRDERRRSRRSCISSRCSWPSWASHGRCCGSVRATIRCRRRWMGVPWCGPSRRRWAWSWRRPSATRSPRRRTARCW